jgi:hypothetical protein
MDYGFQFFIAKPPSQLKDFHASDAPELLYRPLALGSQPANYHAAVFRVRYRFHQIFIHQAADDAG